MSRTTPELASPLQHDTSGRTFERGEERNKFKGIYKAKREKYKRDLLKAKHLILPSELFKQQGQTESGTAKSFALKILAELYPHSPHEQTIDQTATIEESPFQDTEIRQVLKTIPQNKTPDINGAFDHLQYHAIRERLKKLNLNTSTLVTLKSYFTLNDRQVVLQTNEGPVFSPQKQGCPHCSRSGPMSWYLIVDEILAEEFRPDFHLQTFADDFDFHICSGTRDGLKILNQQTLDIFKTWTDSIQLRIYTSKSAYMLIGKIVRGPTIKWGTESIKRTRTIKHLGIILDEKLNWAAHIKHQSIKASLTHQRMARIVRATWDLKQEHRRILYSTMSESMILHGAASWALNIISVRNNYS
ncbi:Putative protein in type-1 retrotransposable element R1DM [Araneus ventricosus]|uniref:Reverse transcriptase domain-containing protein n=1 Tax=Araneus ventricosus TaxID=182803 RepID=A0A4Y2FJ07_ARAVE|nr:Putative protein in type-1 retrotransposable element R1DM [Araneus ventricosus]